MQRANSKNKVWVSVTLGLISFALYLPSLRFDFLDFDDQQYVTENLVVRAGMTLKGVVWAFGYRAGNWHPLTWLSHMLDCQVYGLHSGGHHLTNLLLHSANTVLLFLILLGMTNALWRSAIVAALFGWHPLHVESVAWIAERKDVLSAFFFMLTLGAYLKYLSNCSRRRKQALTDPGRAPQSVIEPPYVAGCQTNELSRRVWYIASLLVFALGLMSKPMLVTLPFVLLLLDFWPLNRFQLPISDYRSISRLLLEKV